MTLKDAVGPDLSEPGIKISILLQLTSPPNNNIICSTSIFVRQECIFSKKKIYKKWRRRKKRRRRMNSYRKRPKTKQKPARCPKMTFEDKVFGSFWILWNLCQFWTHFGKFTDQKHTTKARSCERLRNWCFGLALSFFGGSQTKQKQQFAALWWMLQEKMLRMDFENV